jgi:glycosyltransferase involved in cell wall biosynthesis
MLSIIIPTLNEEKYLPKLLENIRNQKFNNYEIIVSDGDSQDKTQEIAKKYKAFLISSPIRHPSHQRNQGAKLAKGNVLLFLDADTAIPDDFLELAFNEFNKRKISVASFYLKFNSSKNIYKLYNSIYGFLCFLFQYIKPLSVGAAIMSDKNIHNKINGFDESVLVGEDHDYAQRSRNVGKFRMIKSTFFYFSPRRWEKEGHLTTIKKLIKMFKYTLVKGSIKKKIVDYDFGNF